jgi:hypothetical protein
VGDQHDLSLLKVFHRLVALLGRTGKKIDDQTTWSDLGMNKTAVTAFVQVQCRQEFGIRLNRSDAGKTVSDLAVSIHNALGA